MILVYRLGSGTSTTCQVWIGFEMNTRAPSSVRYYPYRPLEGNAFVGRWRFRIYSRVWLVPDWWFF